MVASAVGNGNGTVGNPVNVNTATGEKLGH